MKSIAEQHVAEMGGKASVLTRQKRDHVKLDQLLHRLVAASPGEQDQILLRIYRLVFPHAFAEEAVLWPAIRRALPDGEELTLRVELEHQEINELVTRLEASKQGSPERRQLLDQLVDLLRQDVRDEEDELLPRLQMKLTSTQLRLLGLAWEAVRQVAPTRAHPIVARRPPGNVLAALPLALIDRGRDGVDTLLHSRPGPGAQPLQALSSGLTRLSHRVERLPGLKSGEHPATRVGGRSGFGWGAAAMVALAAGSAAMLLARRRRQPAG